MSNDNERTNQQDAAVTRQENWKPEREADQIQRLLAELEKHKEETARMEAKLQRLLEARQTGNADSPVAYGQRKPAPAQKKKPTARKNGNVLSCVGNHDSDLSLDGITKKTAIKEICFLNTRDDAPRCTADLSQAKNHSVECWTEEDVLYIAGDGGVAGGVSCANLFDGYENVTAIWFDRNFDTSYVKNMGSMFHGCHSLTALDLTGFDTSHVEYMSRMFSSCGSLTALDLSSWDTSSVTDMCGMFEGCNSLTTLDLSSFDTSNVVSMDCMFQNCHSLTTLNLSGWDTSHVTDMHEMFLD
ncbi:MAG: DUF285 domain-containing protein, partial [Clostridiales bacterium]|nr:DUF285 domain-containing protein [Clostridiales bacterium]